MPFHHNGMNLQVLCLWRGLSSIKSLKYQNLIFSHPKACNNYKIWQASLYPNNHAIAI